MSSEPYLRTKVSGRLIRCHRVVWEELNSPIPEGMMVHHVNGDRRDNRIGNLKLVTLSEHMKIHHPRRNYPERKRVYCLNCGKLLNPGAIYYNQKRCKSHAARERERLAR